MKAWFHCSGASLLARDPDDLVGRLASAQQARGYPGTPEQEFAWRRQVVALREAIAAAGGQAWTIALEYELLRLEKRVDAVVLCGFPGTIASLWQQIGRAGRSQQESLAVLIAWVFSAGLYS